MRLRSFQSDAVLGVEREWQTHQNVCLVAPTGAGKTVMLSHLIQRADCPAIAIAHRQELVGQMSLTLARNGIRHRIIAPDSVIRFCVANHVRELGKSFYNAAAHVGVAGVDTVIRREDVWFKSVQLWVMDETHHLLKKNKWGRAVDMFPGARGLGVTATPVRADGAGLGRWADGYFDTMVLTPGMRDIINMGFLTDYRIFAPQSDIDFTAVPIAADGDLNLPKLREATHKSKTIIGDVVSHYLLHAAGKLGVTFCVDVESATEHAAAYRAAGIPAEVVSAKTPDHLRMSILRKFAAGEIKQLCNVDLFGEGFDLPAIEVVSMVRRTEAFGLYAQQFGRALRTMDGKQHAIIIDHVGNVMRHGGPPDVPRVWTLDRAEKRSRGAAAPSVVRVCPDCTAAYDRAIGLICPFCGFDATPAQRSAPEFVDGVLSEMSPEFLAKLRGDQPSLTPAIPYNATPVVVASVKKNHRERLEALDELKQTMLDWSVGKGDVAEAQRRFYIKFGIDVGTAQTLHRADAVKLKERIENDR